VSFALWHGGAERWSCPREGKGACEAYGGRWRSGGAWRHGVMREETLE